MIELKTRRSKILFYLGMFVLSIAVVFFLLRGPYLSNFTKRLIIPTLENATRERVIIGQAAINLFPFYVQAKSVKVFDKEGKRILWITKTRAYIDISGLFLKEIRIRKFWFKEPTLTTSKGELDNVIQNVKSYVPQKQAGGFKLSLRNIEIIDGTLDIVDLKDTRSYSGSGISLDITAGNNSSDSLTTAKFALEEVGLMLPGFPNLNGSLKGLVKFGNNRVEIADLKVDSTGYSMDLTGEVLLASDGRPIDGELNGNIDIQAEAFDELFGLKQSKAANLYFEGKAGILPGKGSWWPGFELDLKTDSNFYLESLMDILDIEENVTGLVSVKGDIKGEFPDITGKGAASLKNAVFDALPFDDLQGEIEYRDGRFTLTEFVAHTYEGKLDGKAHIDVPSGDYAVSADVSGVSSVKLFRYIGWDAPFLPGRVNGKFSLNHERDLEITAEVNYLNEANKDGNLLNRLRSLSTSLDLKGDTLVLADTVFFMPYSRLFLKGAMDLDAKTLSLDLSLDTDRVNDLTAPYYMELEAPLTFTGRISGKLEAPEISGTMNMSRGTLHGIPVTGAAAEISYKYDSLVVDLLRLEQGDAAADISGKIDFRGSNKLFSFKDPYYSLKGSIYNTGIKQFVDASRKDFLLDGIASGKISFEGDAREFTGKGDLVVTDASLYGQKIERAVLKTTFQPDRITFYPLNVYNGTSELVAEGTLFYDGKFDLSLSSGDFDTCDINMLEDHSLGVRFNSLKVTGTGTMEKPDLKFRGQIIESYLNKREIGTGDIDGTLRGRDLQFKGSFVGGLLTAAARADLSGRPAWNADIDVTKGNYDFLLSGLIDKAPDDISLSLKGGITVRSTDSGHIVQSKFDHLELGVWGYDLMNDKDVVLDIVDKELFIKSFSLTGDSTDIYASGSVKFGESYDVAMLGNVDVASLASVSNKISSLKGQGTYIINILGDWDSPEMNGEINVKDATVQLADMSYKIGPMNGKFILDRGKVTFDSVRTRFAGGSIDLSGAGYLEMLDLKKLYVSAQLNDIKVRPLERVNVALGGRLFYETSPEGSSFTGDIDIKKAKYEKDVKFDKLILGLKAMETTKAQYPEFLRKTDLNIHVEGKENILIDNNVATTPVSISLNLMGTVEKYGLIGKVDALGGNIYFRSNEFNILDGSSVEFVDPGSMLPVFHVLAESYISDYYIKLTLDGTMDQFNLSLFSNPPLSEMDILALLTFGQFRKESKGFESGLAASEAASMLTGDLQEAVASKFRNLTGVDRFEVEPHTAATGAFGPKITVGKRLIEDKLSVIYSTSIGTTEENIIKLKYHISNKISLIGSRDEIGSAGVDLKYKFEFK